MTCFIQVSNLKKKKKKTNKNPICTKVPQRLHLKYHIINNRCILGSVVRLSSELAPHD